MFEPPLFISSIAAPWYGSYSAVLLFAFLVASVLFVAFLWLSSRSRQKELLQEKEAVAQRVAAANTELEMLRKRLKILEEGQEQVKQQLRSKTITLVKKTKENDEKARLLQTLKEEVETITKENSSTKFQWREVSRLLRDYEAKEDNKFSVLMEELHQDFLTRLNKKHPGLTTYDQRLCIYIKSGMTTREMAELINVLPSSVNVSRSRLRKKLELAPKADLYKFLKAVN